MHDETKVLIQARVEELTCYINRNLKWIEEGDKRIKHLQKENVKYEDEIKQLLMDLQK